MSNPAKKRKPGRKTPPLSREQLLPMATPLARDASLKAHVALAAMRSGQGNVALLGELMKTVYLTYLLSATHRPDLAEGFAAGQKALNDNFATGPINDEWALDAAVAALLAPILLEHDAQLARRPLHVIEAHQDRLTRMLKEGRFPNLGKPVAANLLQTADKDSIQDAIQVVQQDARVELEAFA
jgi:hypothetical protein